jgi:hypothetical protein
MEFKEKLFELKLVEEFHFFFELGVLESDVDRLGGLFTNAIVTNF